MMRSFRSSRHQGMPVVLATALGLAVLGCASRPPPGTVSGNDPRAPLTVHDVGEYAAVPWDKPGTPVTPGSRADRVRDLTFAIASVNLTDTTSDAKLQEWAEVARWGRAQDKKLLPRLHFWDGADRYEGPLRDLEVYWQRLDRFLAAVDLADLHGIVLAEENVHYAGRPAVLTELYRRVKAKYGIPVWQWWSPRTAIPESGGWIPADGWVIDPYMTVGHDFRQYLRKYVIAGKPVVVMPWASVMGGNTDQTYFDGAPTQLAAAVEFGLPVAFFWCKGTTCYFGAERTAHETLMDRTNQRVWEYIRQVRALPKDFRGLSSADVAEAPPVELKADGAGLCSYDDDFRLTKCIDDASMTGFRDLLMDGKGLHLRGFAGRRPKATLTYCFVTEKPVCYPRVQVEWSADATGAGAVKGMLSADGRHWKPLLATGAPGFLETAAEGAAVWQPSTRFWVRIRLVAAQPGTEARPAVTVRKLAVRAAL